MGNKPPEGAQELKHIFLPQYKNDHLFVLASQEQIAKGQVPVFKATLFTQHEQQQLPCVTKTVLKSDPEGSVILKLFAAYQEQISTTTYPEFVVQIFGMVEEPSAYTIVMEQMAGNLYHALYGEKFVIVRNAWKEEDREKLALTCLKTVTELHKLGVVHRDIKPGNFLVNDDATIVKLCDFGSIKETTGVTTNNLKQFGGTVPYMAPERMTDEDNFKLSAEQWIASDLYSLGVVMCEIITGAIPFNEPDYTLLYHKRLQERDMQPYDNSNNIFGSIIQHSLLSIDSSMRTATPILEHFSMDPFMQAVKWLYERNNSQVGISLLYKSAKKSNVFACQLLVQLFRNGTLAEKNESLAWKFGTKRDHIKQASSHTIEWLLHHYTHVEDLHLLVAYAYYSGWGCTKDFTKHYEICQQYPSSHCAQTWMGRCFFNGEHVKKDCLQAVHWYKLAAEQGNANAQNNLGVCYAGGNGVFQDLNEALKWFKTAAEQGNADAQNNLGICYYNAQGMEKHDYEQAAYWYKLAAVGGNAEAQYNMGVCFVNGHGVEQDFKQAVHWYKLAAEQGNADAQNNLAVCYKNGDGVAADAQVAYELFQLASKQGNESALLNLKQYNN